MELQSYIDKMKNIQKNLLEFIDSEENIEENFQNLTKIFHDENILKSKHKIKTILYILLNIANNHHRTPNFFSKIEKILIFMKDSIKQTLSKHEIFEIFKLQKRILLFFIKENLIEFDQDLSNELISDNAKNSRYLFTAYFFKEMKPYLSRNKIKNSQSKILENSEELKEIGENETEICQIIRQGSIADFMSHVSTYRVKLSSKVQQSAYETNTYLVETNASLVEYAAFHGSVEIMRYLIEEKVEVKPSIFLYAIHSRNDKIFKALEDYKIEINKELYGQLIQESIKCNHIEFLQFFEDKLNKKSDNIIKYCLHFYNFLCFPNENINNINGFFISACKYDQYDIVEILLKKKAFDINMRIISTKNFFNEKVLDFTFFKYNFS